MKNKCAVCSSVKGQRLCKLDQLNRLICSKCCATTRNAECNGCSNYLQAERYSAEKSKKLESKQFIAMIDPEVDEAVDKALEFVEKGNIKKGEALLLGLLERHPHLYIVHYGMGVLLSIKEEFPEAIKYFDKCLEIFPYFPEAWFNRANTCIRLADIRGVMESLQKVILFGDEKEDYFVAARSVLSKMEAQIFDECGLSLEVYIQTMEKFDKAVALMGNRKYEDAIAVFSDVLNIHKNHQQSYGNLGLCLALTGNRQAALAALDRALEIDPKYKPAKINRKSVLAMKEGENLPGVHMEVVDYYKELR